MKEDFYQVLGIEKKSSQAEIKKAYRQAALKWHPDKNKSSEAEKKFKTINQAYEVLSNPQKRQQYDQFGHDAFDPASGSPGTGRTGPFAYTYSSGGNPFGNANSGFGGFSDPFQIFETFFGGASPFRRGPAKPHYSLKVDFMDAIDGCTKEVTIQGRNHKIKIPPGADDGTRIRYSDFDVSVDVGSHPQFKRDGADIFIDHQISLTDALLGTTIEVPTVKDKIKLKVRPGTQPGSLIRLRGQGALRIGFRSHGDQYVRLVIDFPSRLSRQQKKILKDLQSSGL